MPPALELATKSQIFTHLIKKKNLLSATNYHSFSTQSAANEQIISELTAKMERMERIQESAAKSHIFPAQFTGVGRYMRMFLVIGK